VSWITLSPKAYKVWQNLLAIHFRGDGFIVDIISHSAIRYREGARSITLSTEPRQIEDNGKKADWVLAVYVHRPLRWDDAGGGEVSDPAQERSILSRIELALRSKVSKYEFMRDAVSS
jgi:hypothetical protein